MKGGVGLDYFLFRRKDQPKSDLYRLVPDHSEPLTSASTCGTPRHRPRRR